jgi:hypothetical protein
VVRTGDQLLEDIENLDFEIAREVFVAPSLANELLCPGTVALQQQRAS